MGSLALLFDAPAVNLQLLADGILVGAIFALVAYGVALVWGVMNLINVAQGELVILGGYVLIYLAGAGLPPLLGVPLAAAVVAAVSWLLYRLVIFRVVERDLFTSILATFARIKLLAFAATLLLAAALVLFLRRSRLGQAIRATAQNARAARILGIDTDRVYAATFAINGAICGAAGGLTYTVRSFMVVIVAGLGNLGGVILAGTGLGIAENYAGFILGAEYQTAFVFTLLVVLLVGRNLLLRRQRKYLR